MTRYAADTPDTGPVGIIPLNRGTMARAQQYVVGVPIRTLDGIHLAACAQFEESTLDEVQFLSRDNRQNQAAPALGIVLLEG